MEEDSQTIEYNNYIINKDKEILDILGGYISNRRIRILFRDDEEREYTDRCLDVIDFLKSLPNSLIYNPQEESIWD